MNAITQKRNNAITIILVLLLCLTATSAYAGLRNNQSADVVIGQANFTSREKSCRANTLNSSCSVFSDGKRLFIADLTNNRVLIYNTIPTTNNALADVVVGQANFTSGGTNQGLGTGSCRANTLYSPRSIFSDGRRLFIADYGNHRVLIYNTIPTANNASADVVIGQANFTTNSSGTAANKFNGPFGVFSDGKRLFIAEYFNHRVLIYNTIPTTNNASADVVVGQADFTSNTANQTGWANVNANTLGQPTNVFSDGKRLFIADYYNHRVLIYNTIPTANNALADVVVGQANFTSRGTNQELGTGSCRANTLYNPHGVFSDGKRLFIAEYFNNRALIYNTIPTTNNASADVVVGQADFTSNTANQTGWANVNANTLYRPTDIFSDGKRLFIADFTNSRILIYNIDSLPAIKLGPQFEQGKAVLGKVYNDINGNGIQDKGELGIEGVKVASDTGIYAITDEDGKYHYPYIETGQHLLKLDTSTLEEGATLTTESPRKITVTKGILTKVSFGVKLPPEAQLQEQSEEGPLLKVSITQDPVLLKPKLQVTAEKIDNNITFTIDCNYFLFIERSILTIYDNNYKRIKTIPLPKPIPSKYTLPIKDLPPNQQTFYYQLSVYDKKNNEDRTGIGSFEIK